MKQRTLDMIIVRMRMKTETVKFNVNNADIMQRQMRSTNPLKMTFTPVFRFMIYKQSPIQKK